MLQRGGGRVWLVPLGFAVRTLQSLGVVYGDLGTSPIYTWPTILSDLGNWNTNDLMGAMCIMSYTIIIIVCIKYTIFVMSANNKGEGGIFSLFALIPPRQRKHYKKSSHKLPSIKAIWFKRICTFIAILGAAFILSDGAITPAIEVLSAVEGMCYLFSSLLYSALSIKVSS